MEKLILIVLLLSSLEALAQNQHFYDPNPRCTKPYMSEQDSFFNDLGKISNAVPEEIQYKTRKDFDSDLDYRNYLNLNRYDLEANLSFVCSHEDYDYLNNRIEEFHANFLKKRREALKQKGIDNHEVVVKDANGKEHIYDDKTLASVVFDLLPTAATTKGAMALTESIYFLIHNAKVEVDKVAADILVAQLDRAKARGAYYAIEKLIGKAGIEISYLELEALKAERIAYIRKAGKASTILRNLEWDSKGLLKTALSKPNLSAFGRSLLIGLAEGIAIGIVSELAYGASQREQDKPLAVRFSNNPYAIFEFTAVEKCMWFYERFGGDKKKIDYLFYQGFGDNHPAIMSLLD